MRPDHAPIVDVVLRCTVDFRDDDLRARYVTALAAQVGRNCEREWREHIKAKRSPATKPSNVFELVQRTRL